MLSPALRGGAGKLIPLRRALVRGMPTPTCSPALRRSSRLAGLGTAVSVGQEPVVLAAASRKRKTQLQQKSDEVEVEENRLSPSTSEAERVETRRNPPGRRKAAVSEATEEKEQSLWRAGYKAVCGVDEAGRGPLAGPVVAAACVIPEGISIPGLRDSKKLTEAQREQLFADITTCSGVSYAIEIIDESEIDRINILQATMIAMSGAVSKLQSILGSGDSEPGLDYILVDGTRLPESLLAGCQAEALVKGDLTCRVISAASILAKVTRDRLMLEYDSKYPMYGFKEHKGYGTTKHMAALLKHGPSPIHRRTFAPMKNWVTLSRDAASV